jgi:hypothetical protein
MDSEKLNDWMQVVGIFALVASLIFVGLQMKQSQEIAMTQANQSRLDTNVAMLTASAENPYFVSAFGKFFAGDEEPITQAEYVALRRYGTALLYNFQNTHDQYLNGFNTEAAWQATQEALKSFLEERGPIPMRQTYSEQKNLFKPLFQNVVNGILLEIDAEEVAN